MRVLIADDDRTIVRILQRVLADTGLEVLVAGSGAEAWDILTAPNPPRIAVLDWLMPEPTGIELCQRIRERGNHNYTYVIVLTARLSNADIRAGFDAGADDYVVKPFNLEEFKCRVMAGRRIIELQDQLIAAQRELEFQATHDQLTGLLNRRAMLPILEQHATAARRLKTEVSVMLLDIDHFKKINDTWGHFAGDEVLRQVSNRIKNTLRVSDAVCRYGGEEFLCVLPETTIPHPIIAGERVREAIALEPVAFEGHLIPVTASVGVARYHLDQNLTVQQLLARADEALYRAKQSGRDRVVVAA